MMIQATLGFGGSPRPTRIFIGKEVGALWYFWNSDKNEPIAIEESSLHGYIRSIARRESVSDYGVTEKLIVSIEADRLYEIVCGFNTWFSKTLLLALNELNETELARTVVLEPTSNNNTKKVIFVNVYNWKKDRVFPKWTWRDDQGKLNEPNLNQLIDAINSRLKAPQDEAIYLEEDTDTECDREERELVASSQKKDQIPF